MADALTPHQVRYDAHVAADLADMAVTRDALASALVECSWGHEDVFRVLICADEAMANALDHGSTSAGAIDIRFLVNPDIVSFVVEDRCAGATEMPSCGVLPADTCERGRGLILMRAFADAFRIQRRSGGTRVVLGFRTTEGWAR